MPICSVGGAACCAGPIEIVKAHETEAHGIRHHSNPMAKQTPPVILPSQTNDADQVMITHILRAEFNRTSNRSAQRIFKDQAISKANKSEHRKRGY